MKSRPQTHDGWFGVKGVDFCETARLLRAAVMKLPARVFGWFLFTTSWMTAASFPATVTLDPVRVLGPVSPEIYGQYLEHVDQGDECIYPSIWDDRSPLSDAMGLRRDVVAAVRELKVPVIRWPGGCFADVYHWENAIGPRARRPVLPNRHWKGTQESHQFGTDEFLRFCELTGARSYLNVNLGSGTLAEALRWLEYCNGSLDTPQGKRRAANGRREPYEVLRWGIGNETWGPWETGHTDAATYARLLAHWARALRAQDPRIKILAVGSEEGKDPAWDRAVLEQAGELIDYLTLHTYGFSRAQPGEYDQVVYTPEYMETRMRRMLATIDAAVPHRADAIRISVDEWNIRRVAQKLDRKAPRNLQDSLFVAGVLNTFIRLSPRIAMANYVFLVNGHAPLLVSGAQVVKTPLFHVFSKYIQALNGTALDVQLECPQHLPPRPLVGGPRYKPPPDFVPQPTAYLNVAAVQRADGTLAVAVVNRHARESAEVGLNLPAGFAIDSVWTLHAADVLATNTFAEPNRIVPAESVVDGRLRSWPCPPHSVVVLTLAQRSP